jgi:excisionase family DNA binding protein
MTEDEILSPREVSRLWKVSRPFPYVLAHRGVLPFHKLGKTIRFKRSDIERFFEESRVEKK